MSCDKNNKLTINDFMIIWPNFNSDNMRRFICYNHQSEHNLNPVVFLDLNL